MRRNREQLQILASRQAFTLVEMLIVCAVIGILATLTLVAVSKAATASKVAKTRATIQKLDVALRQIFMSYEDQFDAIKRRVAKDYPTLSPEERQKIAAHFIRDLMRMEMPQNWEEVEEEPVRMAGGYSIEESPLLEYYRTAKNQATEQPPERGALLFLIIQNLNPEALEAFHGSEVADTDGDGLLEFVDAWGQPIRFLRWTPAFHGSDLQPDVLEWLRDPKYDPKRDNSDWWRNNYPDDPRLQAAMADARAIHADPMDERENADGWFLYPLIYSAGPDGDYGIDEGKDESPGLGRNGILDPFAYPFGMPKDSSHFDNIHNHQWYRSF
jgi:prepilin-type N-terminal cleavage/methylation domain-containing protein